jgi:hypothetical protein
MRALQTEERPIFSMDWRQLAGAVLAVVLAGATSIDRKPLPRAIAGTALSRIGCENPLADSVYTYPQLCQALRYYV